MLQRHNYQAIKVPMQRKAPADHSSSILNLDPEPGQRLLSV
jgi:hypothetical protein